MNKEYWEISKNPEYLIGQIKSFARYNRKLRLIYVALCKQMCNDDYIKQLIDVSEQYADGNVSEDYLTQTNISRRTSTNNFEDICSHQLKPNLFRSRCSLDLNWQCNQSIGFQIDVIKDIVHNPYIQVNIDNINDTIYNLAQNIYEQNFDPLLINMLSDALEENGYVEKERINWICIKCNNSVILYMNKCTPWAYCDKCKVHAVAYVMCYKVECNTCEGTGQRGQDICENCKNIEESQILKHLRTHPFHVKGCWVIDLILGKQ